MTEWNEWNDDDPVAADKSPAGTYKLVSEAWLCTWLNSGWDFVAVTTPGEPATQYENGKPAEVLIRKGGLAYGKMVQALEDAEKTIDVLDTELGQAMDLLAEIFRGGRALNTVTWAKLEAYVVTHDLK